MCVAVPFCRPSHTRRPDVSEVGINACPTGATAGHMVTDMVLNPLTERSRDQLKK